MKWLLAAVMVVAAMRPAHADAHRKKVATALSSVGVGVSGAIVLSSFLVGDTGTVDTPVFAVGLASGVVTPSLGELYAHQWLTLGEGIRLGGAALALYAVTRTHDVGCDGSQPGTATCTELDGSGVALLGIAAIAFIGGAAYDVVDAPDAVDRHDLQVGLAPLRVPGGGGLAIAGRF
jgi:hypothetical protein